jgi:ATP-dependent helicase/nuclease subunit B
VTEIETLMRDPYSVYARRLLELKPLDPLDADPGAREHGQIIHAVLERFVRRFPEALPERADDVLLELGVAAFRRLDDQPEMQALWWPRFKAIATWFIAEERQRRALVQRVTAESVGSLALGPDGRYTIRARADRLELRDAGGLGIGDYKTGSVPALAEIRAGLSPQLPLEAAIAQGGGFAGLGGAVQALEHWPLRASLAAQAIKPAAKPEDLEALIKSALEGVTALFDIFADPATPFFAVPRPEVAPRYNAYEHLARIKEWRGGGHE